ncbi:MAG: undecaprenyldiphospho-muramoylpentapeptide beta-N-acetylglucosaminyltransferase [Gammaproteobacteria bacterium]|nr:undecaprenyldiphospho-muramoylpentapeptide beta-N-acetylglucosaminyltransferase [Gammaproteobacteria bacterium]
MTASSPVLIMAGGTGGHVFPALAVARELRERNESVIWLGTERGLESRVVPADGFPLELVRVSGLRRKGLLSWMLAPFKLLLAIWDAIRLVRMHQPKVVLGMGGFASGPGGVAAWLLRRPLIIHEQNAAAGLTNRLLALFATRVLQGFPEAFSSKVQAQTIGNPVRTDIFELPSPEQRMSRHAGPLRLLVLGGSQGALVLNETVPAAVAELAASESEFEIWHQSGRATYEAACKAYSEADVDAHIEPFIEDMNKAYGWADLVVCRAGALTIAELAAAGLGSVLVPYPSAVDDHQTRNALFMVEANAAILIPQPALSAVSLAEHLQRFATNREQLVAMAINAHAQAKPEAAHDLMQACLYASNTETAAAA